MRTIAIWPMIGVLTMAASPPPHMTPAAQMPQQFLTAPPAPTPAETPPGFTAAPTPNDLSAPITPASKDTKVGPGFFTRKDQYRGEGISAGSSAQIEQDRRAMPGAGINITMPLQ